MRPAALRSRRHALDPEPVHHELRFAAGPLWTSLATLLAGGASDEVVRCCDDCGRMRVGTDAWRPAVPVRLALRRRGLALPQRASTCHDCLVTELPEYFSP